MNVYIAYTDEQKICGMLNFTDETFIKDGMLFIEKDDKAKTHYFHTEGMKMDIRIMGVICVEINKHIIKENNILYIHHHY